LRLMGTGCVAFSPRFVIKTRRGHHGQWRATEYPTSGPWDDIAAHVQALPSSQRAAAVRVIRGYRYIQTGRAADLRREYRLAVAAYAASYRLAPELFHSPILGRYLVNRFLRATAGLVLRPRGAAAARWAYRSARAALR